MPGFLLLGAMAPGRWSDPQQHRPVQFSIRSSSGSCLLAAVELLPVSLGFGSEVTMGFPIHLAVAIIFSQYTDGYRSSSPASAPLDMRELRGEIPLWRAAFNRTQTMLAVGTAAVTFVHLKQPGRIRPTRIIACRLPSLGNEPVSVAGMVISIRECPYRTHRGLIPKPVCGFAMSYLLLACWEWSRRSLTRRSVAGVAAS